MDTARADTLADLLRSYRLSAGLTQEELAERAGLGVRSVSDIERGVSRTPQRATLEALARGLRLSAAQREAMMAAARGARCVEQRAAMPSNRPATALAASPTLTVPLTPLLGREHEEAAALHLLRRPDVRLLTLTGPGGVGKTRLAQQVAASMTPEIADAVSVVPLAAIRDADLVLLAIAQRLGVSDDGSRPLAQALAEALHDQRLLLLLDNFEQLLPVGRRIAELLCACPQLKILVTSRAPLRLRGEQELAVGPLALPDPGRLPPAEELSRYAAIALFLQRARAVKPAFAVGSCDAPALVEICRRLDGLPLAIELAAARLRVLPLQELLARLERPLDVLIGGAQDLPERQQTLRNTLAWSYDLLSAGERRLFARLAAFPAGCTLEAVEAICGEPGDGGALDGLSALVSQSLVRQSEQADGQPRFTMLATIREFALEQACRLVSARPGAAPAWRSAPVAARHARGAPPR
jgi:predicted ATPase/DNA-binding XRE family transcriptional regulator